MAVRETAPGERRVALVPDTVARLRQAGYDVAVERGAGLEAGHDDPAYLASGAEVVDRAALAGADAVVSVQPLPVDDARMLTSGALTVSFLVPAFQPELLEVFVERQVSALSFDLLPRISRAQPMDALSSQALCAGYRVALLAATRLPRFFPLAMTAAGTIPPAKVLVLGAGVAGLQAVATARRLGAVVSAYDVRAAAAEEVRSLGATFVELQLPALEGTGGYAREMGQERALAQQAALAPVVAASDVVLTTAAVPGRQAPLLLTAEMVSGMRRGTVVVDGAADSGGNCALTVPGDEVDHNGVLVLGPRNLPSALPADASRLYARNVANLLLLATPGADPAGLAIDDEVVAGCAVTYRGEVRPR